VVNPFNPLRYGGWIGNFEIKRVATGPGKDGKLVDDLEVSPTHAPGVLPASFKMRFPAGYGGQLESGDILTLCVARKTSRVVYDEPLITPEEASLIEDAQAGPLTTASSPVEQQQLL
jgi:hypothetical protein